MNKINTFFIAEISSNHNNNIERIEKLINEAKFCGFDAVKFQLFKIDNLFHPIVLQYSKKHSSRKKWELKKSFLEKIKRICIKKKIKLGFTPFDIESVREINKMADFLKIASYEILREDLIREVSKCNKKTFISTGMANLKEIIKAYNFAKKNNKLKNNVELMHCVSSYPASYKHCNLSFIKTLKDRLKAKVGWSDHSVDFDVINRAFHKWEADSFELHFDLDKKGYEANVGHCWLPNDCKKIITSLKKFNEIDGSKIKKMSKEEKVESNWRSDPIDGYRPLKKIRNNLKTILR